MLVKYLIYSNTFFLQNQKENTVRNVNFIPKLSSSLSRTQSQRSTAATTTKLEQWVMFKYDKTCGFGLDNTSTYLCDELSPPVAACSPPLLVIIQGEENGNTICRESYESINRVPVEVYESFKRIFLEGCEGWNKLRGEVKASISNMCDSRDESIISLR
ncbi:hypothetical protein E3N88_15960 [Mikania micrantha]|uniref:Uncharacterized protein n=1 Tax=Mikania micrantha TaxID=192012 RepID=A0A5N6NWW7_9ASTR|nr:hypothetical protein E3N88_15960 [Mikania micrantha]